MLCCMSSSKDYFDRNRDAVLALFNVEDAVKALKDHDMETLMHILYDHSTDEAHKVPHIKDVMDTAYKMFKSNSFRKMDEVDEMLFLKKLDLAVVFHDCATTISREHHEFTGADVFTYLAELAGIMEKKDIIEVHSAIQQHRGSYDGLFTYRLSELVSAADRGNPKDLRKIVIRSYQYAVDNNSIDPELHALLHVKDKYARNGYANLSDVYKDYYRDSLETFWHNVDLLSLEKVKEIVESVR